MLALMVFVAVIAGAYWWTTRIPSRPNSISADAVYLWAPHVGFPRSPKGIWLSCRIVSRTPVIRCALIENTGSLSYEGDFELANQISYIGAEELIIDTEKTRRDWLNVRGIPVPLIYLKNGKILLPKEAREQALRMLKQLESIAQKKAE